MYALEISKAFLYACIFFHICPRKADTKIAQYVWCYETKIIHIEKALVYSVSMVQLITKMVQGEIQD